MWPVALTSSHWMIVRHFLFFHVLYPGEVSFSVSVHQISFLSLSFFSVCISAHGETFYYGMAVAVCAVMVRNYAWSG
jgi:hypothetical protein